MESRAEGLCTDEEDQRVRSTKKVKRNNNGLVANREEILGDVDEFEANSGMDGENVNETLQHDNNIKKTASYKHMLMGVNGVGSEDSSDEKEYWDDDFDSDVNMHDQENAQLDPLCPSIQISTEERMNL